MTRFAVPDNGVPSCIVISSKLFYYWLVKKDNYTDFPAVQAKNNE
jgi:hypothetical protein